MADQVLTVSPSPHITSHNSTRRIMAAVSLALLPTLVASAFIFGPRVLLLTGVTVVSCVAFEALWCLVMKKPQPIGDLSAVVTGLLLAFNLPPGFPLWQAAVGSLVSIVIAKQLFGGIGFNFANPAIVGRIVLQLSFTGRMITYTEPLKTFGGVDTLASATPLAASGELPLVDLLLGTHSGVLGETCAITILLGGLLLVLLKVIDLSIPLTYIGGTFLFTFLLGLMGEGATAGSAAYSALCGILSGGLLLGAFFMATDYTTSPYTLKGKLIFGVGLAVLTVAMREWSRSPEGVSYAILLMNLLVPYINSATRQQPLGVAKKRKPGKEAKAGKEAV